MKMHWLILIILLPLWAWAQKDQLPVRAGLRQMPQKAYQVGEELEYGIRYGLIQAGVAHFSVQKETQRAGRRVHHIVATGRSVGMAEWFFRTRDRYESFIDVEALAPWEFIREIDEGGYRRSRHLIFDQVQGQVRDIKNPKKGSFAIDPHTQDLLSALYYARALDSKDWRPGDLISFPIFLDYEEFPFRLRFLGRERIDSPWGSITCLKLRPSLQEGRVFKDEEDMTIWVSDDANKIPVLLQTNLLVGSIKVELRKAKGLRHPHP